MLTRGSTRPWHQHLRSGPISFTLSRRTAPPPNSPYNVTETCVPSHWSILTPPPSLQRTCHFRVHTKPDTAINLLYDPAPDPPSTLTLTPTPTPLIWPVTLCRPHPESVMASVLCTLPSLTLKVGSSDTAGYKSAANPTPVKDDSSPLHPQTPLCATDLFPGWATHGVVLDEREEAQGWAGPPS